MDYFKNLLSIEEKKISLIAILLVSIIIYTLYSHYVEKDIANLITLIQSLLFSFVGINGISVFDNYMTMKNKINEIESSNTKSDSNI